MGKRGVILFAHGSRDPLWSRPIEAVAARMENLQSGALVRCAYLELMEPDLGSAVRALVLAGAQQITVVPMFLGVGRHARHDLPRLVAVLALDHPDVQLVLKAAIGEDPRVIDLLASIAMAP